MRYEFVGKKTTAVGKTLWEIVGNLRNFGVGRLFKTSYSALYPELSFCKIVKVQPYPPNKSEFENRRVIVWIEEIFRDRKKQLRPILHSTDYAMFQLIPKIEEEYYLKKAAELKPPVKYLSEYCCWPPLYKKLWEEQNSSYGPIPKLGAIHDFCEGVEIIKTDAELKPNTCSLHKGNMTVDEMYKEMVRLKKIIKSNAEVQKE